MLTIIAYHYIRDPWMTRYPNVRGISINEFEGQLDYITKHYTVCSLRQIVAAMYHREELPPCSCLLTFDDGLLDHYLTVFPRLVERGLVGSFYPSARAIEEHQILDTHKVHFILATAKYQKIIKDIFALLTPYRKDYPLPEDDELYQMYAISNKFAIPEVAFIRNLLLRGLPEKVGSNIVNALFLCYIDSNEEILARELYMDVAQLRCMVQHGMEVSGHGYKHAWLEILSKSEQEEEIYSTLDFLTRIYGYTPSNWVMCYPYGSYNNMTLEILKQVGCALGLTIHNGLVSELTNPLELNRLDTTDIPTSKNAAIDVWTQKAQQNR